MNLQFYKFKISITEIFPNWAGLLEIIPYDVPPRLNIFLSHDERVKGLFLDQLKMSDFIEEKWMELGWGQMGGAGQREWGQLWLVPKMNKKLKINHAIWITFTLFNQSPWCIFFSLRMLVS